MADESKPELKIVEQLDEEEAEFRALRCDLPGVTGAAAAGMLTIGVGKQPTPKHEFFRTHRDFRPVVHLVKVPAGMDETYVAVAPNMIEPLISIGIRTIPSLLYLTVTPRGGMKIIPVGGPNEEGEQNEWSRTKELALIDGLDRWVRMYSDSEDKAYRSYPAPAGRFGEPQWPQIGNAKLFRMAFRDKGRLIYSTDHVLVQKWAGRDRG